MLRIEHKTIPRTNKTKEKSNMNNYPFKLPNKGYEEMSL